MRALRVVGLGIDGRTVILETVAQRSGERRERFILPADEGLHAAVRGDLPRLGQIEIELESQMRPREIQARIRAGASVEQVAAAAGVPTQRIERFAYPVLLERSRTAQLAQQAHPVRSDGPDVRTLEEVVSETFGKRGHDYSAVTWDSWRGENGKWVVQLRWRAGRSDNKAHWTFHPGAHGGTVTAIDDHASDLIDPQPAAQLRPVAPVTPLTGADLIVPAAEPDTQEQPPTRFEDDPVPPAAHGASRGAGAEPEHSAVADSLANEAHRARAVPDDGPAAQAPKRGRKDRPIVPSWEDVLLGVRSPRE